MVPYGVFRESLQSPFTKDVKVGTCSFRLVMSISSSRSSSKLVNPEGSGTTFLITGSSPLSFTEKLNLVWVASVVSSIIGFVCFHPAILALVLSQARFNWCLSSSILRKQDFHSSWGFVAIVPWSTSVGVLLAPEQGKASFVGLSCCRAV